MLQHLLDEMRAAEEYRDEMNRENERVQKMIDNLRAEVEENKEECCQRVIRKKEMKAWKEAEEERERNAEAALLLAEVV